MRRTAPQLILLAALLSCLAFGSCSYTQTEETTKQYIEKSEKEWAQSAVTGDTTVWKKILADDFVWVVDGQVVNKKQALAFQTPGKSPFISNHLDTITVRLFGNTAVAQGTESWVKKSNDSTTVKGKFIWTDTWVERYGVWQIVAAEDNSVAEK